VVAQDDARLVLAAGTTRLILSLSSIGTKDEQTQAAFLVDDLRTELTELRGRGVDIIEYDDEYLRTDDGIADVGFALSAWIQDPFGNTIGILQEL